MASAEKGLAFLDRSRKDRDSQAMQKNAPSRFPSVFLDDAEVELDLNPIVKGLLNLGDSGMVYGPSGCGKSFMAIKLSVHVAAGIDWFGKRVNQASVVYIAAEAGKSILRRFAACRDEQLGEAREGRIPLKIITRSANLLDDVEAAELMAALHLIAEEIGSPLGLIVIDTVSRMIPGGDENSAQDMTKVVQFTERIRDELGAATLVVHHSGKDASKGARGSNSLYSAMDCVIYIQDGMATVVKTRDGPSGETFPFKLRVIDLGPDADGDPVTTCVVEPEASERAVRDVRLSDSEKIAFAALKEAIQASGEAMPETSAIPAGVRAVKAENWRSTFYRLYLEDASQEAAKKAFSRAKTKLLAQKIAGASDPWVWLW